jgi:hypothetical protein
MNPLQHNYLSLDLPEGWEDASQVIALGPEENGFRPNLVFSQEPLKRIGESAEEFARRQLPQLRQALDEYFLIKEGRARMGSLIGYLRAHSFAMERGEVGQFQFYVVSKTHAFTFTFTHLRERFEDSRELAEKVIGGAQLMVPGLEDAAQSAAN